MIEIELRDHFGITDTDFGPRQERLGQWMVLARDPDTMAGAMFMGYLPQREGAKFLPCLPFVEQCKTVQDEIVEALARKLGQPVTCGIVPVLPPDEEIEETTESEADE